ncbi:hypothetical protein HID58_068195, partial [Brassica napus]
DSPQRLTLLESTVRGVSFAGVRGEAQHPSTGDNSISVRSKWVVRGICGYMVHVHLLHSYCMTNGLAWIGNLWLVSVVVGSLLIRILGPGSRYDNFSCRILFQLAVL